MVSEKALQSWVHEAIAAISAAMNLDELNNARLVHSGDKSPIAQASRALGTAPANDRARLGKMIGEARSAVSVALENRREVLEALRDERVLLEEMVDVT